MTQDDLRASEFGRISGGTQYSPSWWVALHNWDIGPCSSFRAPEIQKNDRTLWWKGWIFGWFKMIYIYIFLLWLFVTNMTYMCAKNRRQQTHLLRKSQELYSLVSTNIPNHSSPVVTLKRRSSCHASSVSTWVVIRSSTWGFPGPCGWWLRSRDPHDLPVFAIGFVGFLVCTWKKTRRWREFNRDGRNCRHMAFKQVFSKNRWIYIIIARYSKIRGTEGLQSPRNRWLFRLSSRISASKLLPVCCDYQPPALLSIEWFEGSPSINDSSSRLGLQSKVSHPGFSSAPG